MAKMQNFSSRIVFVMVLLFILSKTLSGGEEMMLLCLVCAVYKIIFVSIVLRASQLVNHRRELKSDETEGTQDTKHGTHSF